MGGLGMRDAGEIEGNKGGTGRRGDGGGGRGDGDEGGGDASDMVG